MSRANTLSFVLRAKNRLKVMDALSKGKKISSQIEKETVMYRAHVSRTLKELQSHDLIVCVNPEDRAFKFYSLSKKGKLILAEALKLLKP